MPHEKFQWNNFELQWDSIFFLMDKKHKRYNRLKKIILIIILLQITHSHQTAANLKFQTLVKIPREIICFILITVLFRNRCLNRDQLLRKIKWKKALTVLKTDKMETKAANKKDQQGLTVIILSSVKWMDSRVCTT